MVQNLDSGFLMLSVVLVTIGLLLIIVREIYKTKRKIKLRAESPRTRRRQHKVTVLTILAVVLAVSSELLIASLIVSSR